jgi:hypothetical protein
MWLSSLQNCGASKDLGVTQLRAAGTTNG